MLARYYGDGLPRFLSPDPDEPWNELDAQTWNLYSYVANNPLRFLDPAGLDMVEHPEMNVWMKSKSQLGFQEGQFDGYLTLDVDQIDDVELSSFDDVDVGVHEIVEFAIGSLVDDIIKNHEFKHRDLFREAIKETGLADFDKQLTGAAKRIIDKGRRKGWSDKRIREEIKRKWNKMKKKAHKKLKNTRTG